MSPVSSPAASDGAMFFHFLSALFGWIYFLAWSVSFYPQPLLNWRRRSTAGLLIDYPVANVVGFVFYTASTLMLSYSSVVREEYARRNPRAPEPTVRFNDVAFGVHALALCLVTISQFSERIWGIKQGCRRMTRAVLGLCCGCVVAVLWIFFSAVADSTGRSWLDLVYAMGYCKLAVSVAKYMPQAWANYRRKSTVGWSIGQVLLDFTGAVLSIAQLLIDSSLQGDWSGVTGNPVKFGLGNLSLLFDIIFMTQHYILYPAKDESEDSERESLLRRSDERS